MTANPTNGSGTNGQVTEAGAGVVSPIDDEVTRIDAVRHHAGVVGHGALSLAFLAAAVVLVARGMVGSAVLTLGLAYGVALNGVTAYAWDRLREYFAAALGDGAADSTQVHVPRGVSVRTDLLAAARRSVAARTPRSGRVSTETQVELLATTVLAGGLLAALGAAVAVLRFAGLTLAVYLFVAVLLAGIVGAFGRTVYGR